MPGLIGRCGGGGRAGQWLSVHQFYGNFDPLVVTYTGSSLAVDWTGGEWRTSAGSAFTWDAGLPTFLTFSSPDVAWTAVATGFVEVNTELGAGSAPDTFDVSVNCGSEMDGPDSLNSGQHQGYQAGFGYMGTSPPVPHISSTQWGAQWLGATTENGGFTWQLELNNPIPMTNVNVVRLELRMAVFPSDGGVTVIDQLG